MTPVEGRKSRGQRLLDWVERVGNKLPDPAVLFVFALLLTWLASAILAPAQFSETDPRTIVKDASGKVTASSPIRVKNQLTGEALTGFLSKMVKTFTDFPPLGVVLVALLGVGVAEHTGFLNACLKGLLRVTAKSLLTPMLLLVSIVSHAAGDAGYVLVIPLGGIIFAAAGRHPLAGIACTFAGVSGGFSASFLPVLLDPLLQGFTQSAAQIIDPSRTVNPLCNWYFTSASCLVIIGVGWWMTDRLIEPRLRRQLPVDTNIEAVPRMDTMSPTEGRALWAGLGSMALAVIALVAAALPANSPFRSKAGELAGHGAPLMESIVPLIFLLFLLPAVVYGYIAGTVRSHKDVIQGMSKSMAAMSYYLVMAFFAAQFTYVFRESNVGALLALKGAGLLQSWQLPGQMTILGIILITALINLLIGSASAKWALLGPIFVPMLMQVGLSPELTQAAYRIADSSANIITPLLPYFPLIVVYCQRYVKSTGIGTLVSMMLPYSITFLITWTLFLLLYWALGLPLGLQATYKYP
jgi:aminobenzoyl-glutamate transport protein